ncbi:hypothetical protein [Azospirillum sp. B4]|uniref:hypothetical protein n=1 Tax=Azospirillum sp. B4 TaxID=95605 RepID=UPI0005C89FFF|nr:hypothetical protein [Azospirillum sp. B4]
MTTLSWPASVPLEFTEDDFGEELGDVALRTPFDAGVANTRPRYSAVSGPLSGSIATDPAGWATIKDFYRTITLGALRFNAVHPIDGTAVVLRWTAPPKMKSVGGTLMVTVAFEVMP